MPESLKLIICLFVPLLLSGSLVLAHTKYANANSDSDMSAVKYAFSLHPEKGLIAQGLLWVSIGAPIFYFLTLGAFVWWPYSVSITEEGFKKFIEISAIPLGVLSLSLPLSVLVSRFHATQQTALQIRVTKHKNNIDIFYAHRKAMFEYFDRIGEVEFDGGIKAKYKAFPRLHIHAFEGSNAEKGIPLIHEQFFKEVEIHLNTARKFISHTIYSDTLSSQLAYYRIACSSIWMLSTMLNLPELYSEIHKRSFKLYNKPMSDEFDPYLTSVGTTTAELVGAYRYCRGFYRLLCEFSNYQSAYFEKTDFETNVKFHIIDAGSQYLKASDLPIEKMIDSIAMDFGDKLLIVKIT